MKTPVSEIWDDVSKIVTMEELTFLRKCFRAYSSKSHIRNVMHDLDILKKLSPPPQKVLDFGCGIGLQSYLLAKMGYQVIGLETVEDKSLNGFLKGKADEHIKSREASMENVWNVINENTKINFRFYDGKKIPFNDEHFDLIFAYAVLEHIPPDEVPEIINEITRVLKNGGLFYIFQLPQRTSYTEFIARKLGFESHEFLWDIKTANRLLAKQGLKTIYSEKVDMLINHPYKIVNPLFSIMNSLNRFLSHTPLSYFAHHLTIISEKR